MERSSQDLELYTIPSYSSWFSWNNIHEVERLSLREFFDATSITRSPRIYKEYRDFIILKFREDPSRKLSFTEVRKSLVGDISVLHKVFTFLEKWGLINFNVSDNSEKKDSDGAAKAPSVGAEEEEEEEEDEKWKSRVKVEEGAPYGVRVVAAPNSMKPIIPPPQPPSVAIDGGGVVGEVGENGFKWPPLASYSDVYGELMQEDNKAALQCGSCKENCESSYYEYAKEESLILCEKCFKSGNYEKSKSPDDFKLQENKNQGAIWTEAETLLLLESVLKHGDDWDLVAQNIQTKNKLDCISKLMQLPFGDLMLGTGQRKSRCLDISGNISNSKEEILPSGESQKPVKAEGSSHEQNDKDKEHTNEDQKDEDVENEGPPLKRLRRGLNSDVGSSLMKQVTRISTMLGPEVAASATEAAITALCYENQCPKEIFDDHNFLDLEESPETSEQKRAAEIGSAVDDGRPNPTEIQETSSLKNISLNLRMRAATATALGAAAANAKLLADQEEREIGHLVSAMIEAQLNKLRRKMKYFEDLEQIMKKEHAELEELEESLVTERLSALQKVISAGITKSKEPTSLKHLTDTVQ